MLVVNIRGKIAVFSVISVILMFASLVPPALAYEIHIEGIDPGEGFPGMEVYLYGYGATPNGGVVALFDGFLGNMTVGRTVADENGVWEIVFVVPSVPEGDYMVYVVDEESLTSDGTSFLVLAARIKIEYVSPPAGSAGTHVYVRGSGATYNGLVRLYFDEVEVANTIADDWGEWSASFVVPDVEPGNHTITALDVASNSTDTTIFTVTSPKIYVSPQEAAIGSKITVTGEGFAPRSGIYLTFEDLLFFIPIYADENGKFNATIFVPVVNSGNYTIKAIGVYYYGEGPEALANVSFRVTIGLDTLFERIDETQNALSQTQSAVESASDEASSANTAANSAKDEAISAKEAAESAAAKASEARIYALTAMIFAIITAALSATILKRK